MPDDDDSPRPMPPHGGWTLLQAAEALCPAEVAAIRAGGAAFAALEREVHGDWVDLLPGLACSASDRLPPEPGIALYPDFDDLRRRDDRVAMGRPGEADLILSNALARALRARADLFLSGIDLARSIDRVTLSHDVLRLHGASGVTRVSIYLCVGSNRAELFYSFPEMRDGLPPDAEFHSVRVEAASAAKMERRSQQAGGQPSRQGDKRAAKGRGGRSVRPQVAAAVRELGAKLAAEGVPAPGDGGQASLERWFILAVEKRGGSVSEPTARRHVKRAMSDHRKAASEDRPG